METFDLLGFHVKFMIWQGRSHSQPQRLVTAIPNILNKFNLTSCYKCVCSYLRQETAKNLVLVNNL